MERLDEHKSKDMTESKKLFLNFYNDVCLKSDRRINDINCEMFFFFVNYLQKIVDKIVDL